MPGTQQHPGRSSFSTTTTMRRARWWWWRPPSQRSSRRPHRNNAAAPQGHAPGAGLSTVCGAKKPGHAFCFMSCRPSGASRGALQTQLIAFIRAFIRAPSAQRPRVTRGTGARERATRPRASRACVVTKSASLSPAAAAAACDQICTESFRLPGARGCRCCRYLRACPWRVAGAKHQRLPLLRART